MPELPEVETVVREIRPGLVGRVISGLRVSKKRLRSPWSRAWQRAILGQSVESLQRRGKWMFAALSNGRTLVIHLGMTGQLTVVPMSSPTADHTHVVFDLAGTKTQLRFRDIRRFGSVTLLGAIGSVDEYLNEIGLGPEPFEVTAKYWRDQLAVTQRCLKAVLLDQRVVAGVGNIYADESCFAARIYPGRMATSLTAGEVRRLAAAVPAVLTRAIDKRGSTIRDYVGGSGLKGGFQEEFRVYGRTGEPCLRCKKPIERVRLAGRSTHYCPRCQKA